MRQPRRALALLAALCLGATLLSSSISSATTSCGDPNAPGGDWRNYGQDLANSRNQPAESTIGTSNVANLQLAWQVASSGGSYSNTPIIADGCLFLADGGGTVSSLNADTGSLNWSRTFSGNGSSLVGSVITGSPAVGGGRVFAAIGNSTKSINNGWSYDVAMWENSGLPAWPNETGWGAQTGGSGTTLDTTPAAYVVASPVYYNPDPVHYPDGLIFQGFMGGEASSTARGGWVIINATDGSIVKKGYTISDADYAAGHLGASVWSTAAVDTATNYIYVGTGNPASQGEDVNSNAIIKIDGDPSRATFGALVATYHGLPDNYVTAFDLYNQAACQQTGTVRVIWGQTCGQQDLDFGAAPNLFQVGGHTMVGDLQKAGVYHAVRTDTMQPCSSLPCPTQPAWTTIVGTPAFFANADSAAVADGSVFTAGQYPSTVMRLSQSDGSRQAVAPLLDVLHYNPVSVANGVFYSGDSTGTLRAFDASDGVPLFVRNVNQDVGGGALVGGDVGNSAGIAIARHKIYWAVNSYVLVYQLP
ncbi:MAG: outer membrane protein assembly factor BamB family protein [Actinomycetota bacterium]